MNSDRRKFIKSGCLLHGAVNGNGRFIGAAPRIRFQQFRQASFVKIASRTIAIRLNPFRMLRTQVVVNLNLKRRKGAAWTTPDSLSVQRFRSDEHDELDKGGIEVVQNEKLKFVETWPHTVKTEILNLKSYGT